MAKIVRNLTVQKGLVISGTEDVLGAADLPASGATAGTYGDASHTLTVTVDVAGRITAIATNAISAGGMTNPMTTLGDIIYENATPAPARLAGNTSTTKQFLTQTGTGSASAAPAWGTIAAGDLPTPSETVQTKTANYTAVASDSGTLLVFNSASSVTLTLGTQAAGWWVDVVTINAGVLSVSATSINGHSTYPLVVDQALRIVSLGSGSYRTTAMHVDPENETGAVPVTVGTAGGISWQPKVLPGTIIAFGSVATDQSTTSNTFVDLTTPDSVSFTLGATHDLLIEYSSGMYAASAGVGGYSEVFLDGVDQSLGASANTLGASAFQQHDFTVKLASVASGNHTLKVEHHTTSGVAMHWGFRSLKVSILA